MARGVSVIAIDGPVAAGKSVVGRELARRLGFKYLDTGVMYRAITWLALRQTTSLQDEEALGKLAHANPVAMNGLDSDRVLVGEWQVGPELREPAVDSHVSLVSRVPEVRKAMVRQIEEIVIGDEAWRVTPDGRRQVFTLRQQGLVPRLDQPDRNVVLPVRMSSRLVRGLCSPDVAQGVCVGHLRLVESVGSSPTTFSIS